MILGPGPDKFGSLPATVDGSGGEPLLVTGGSGFIGTNLVERLLSERVAVINLDARPPRNEAHRAVWRRADLVDAEATLAVVRENSPAAVVHLAARTDLEGHGIEDYAANTEGTRNLVSALESLDHAPRLIVASTRMVCEIGYQPKGDNDYCPPNPYGESKVETEQIVRASGYRGNWVIVRPTSIWGPWFDMPYRDFFLAVHKGRYMHPRGARIRKSFGYVENTVEQILALLGADEDRVQGRLFYLADYEPIEVRDWADRIRRATGGHPIRSVPLGVLRMLARGGDLLKRAGWTEPPLTSFRLNNLLTDMIYDVEPLREIARELPVGPDDAVARTAEWLRRTGELPTEAPA
jgi:nucleoside-diphosphate-sugar epimerase